MLVALLALRRNARLNPSARLLFQLTPRCKTSGKYLQLSGLIAQSFKASDYDLEVALVSIAEVCACCTRSRVLTVLAALACDLGSAATRADELWAVRSRNAPKPVLAFAVVTAPSGEEGMKFRKIKLSAGPLV